MKTCEEVAKDLVNRRIAENGDVDDFVKGTLCSCVPARDGEPSIWLYMGMPLYADRAGDTCIRLKRGQLGVVLHWPDRSEHRVFNAAVLWDDIVNPKPKQMALWPEVSD